ncbi:ABC transporter substrate-binding protein [Sulfurimonas sp.]|nr:ABC transporter substrate-binding protein [Sulfurimonas sp.]
MKTFIKLSLILLTSLIVHANEKISLQLLWKHQFEFAGFYVAKEKGFYKDAGLDVDIKEFHFGINVVNDVLTKKTDIGIGRSSLILDKLKGKNVVLLNALYQSSPYVLLSLQRPDLKKVEDFKNKRIMLSDNLESIAAISSMMKVKNVQEHSYLKIPHTFNIDDLLHNKTDLMTTYISNEPFHLKEKGIRYTVFDPKDYGFDFYADILFTSNNYLQSNKTKVQKFQEASLKGWEYAFSNIDETIEIILKKYNTQNKTKEALLYEAKALKDLAYVKEIPFGSLNIERIREIANIYRLLGMTQTSNDSLKNMIHYQKTFLNSLQSVLSLELFLSILAIVILFILLSLYRQYILKKQNENLEQIVLEKTQELRLANEDLEEKIAKRTEELLLATRAKSDFLANMSHEIRTPLNGIVGFIDILYKNEENQKKQEKLALIKESSNSLLTIINDILDFSKIESGKMTIEKLPIQLKPIFENMVKLFFDKANEKNVTLKLSIDPNLPVNSIGDDTRIKQVFSNLLSNAIKFSHDNSTVSININYLAKQNKLFCEVIDKGVGIAEDKMGTIFKCFEQANNSISRTHGGTGLGLSITKKLLHLMDGDIGVESTFGTGSKFYFTLQLFDTPEITAIKNTQTIIDSHQLQAHILIVEDNKTNQLLLGMLLDDLDLSYDVANDGLEAIEAVKNNTYDLILMDENMPNMSGKEATKVLRATYSYEQLPIIAVTANALKGDKEGFIASGMNSYLSKPIDADELTKVLHKFLLTDND